MSAETQPIDLPQSIPIHVLKVRRGALEEQKRQALAHYHQIAGAIAFIDDVLEEPPAIDPSPIPDRLPARNGVEVKA